MKTKKTSEISDYENRILPIYRLILRKLFIYFLLILPAFILLPTFFAIVVSVLIILGILDEKRKNSSSGLLTSPWRTWKKYGYDTRILSAILIAAVITLVTVNVLIQPIIFKLLVKLFYLLF